ncbi:MAG TPA: MaoC/PaaZ C-terminal domain-containing protein [Ktedonobacteraceae bacterium]|nr:MaoC/PaaZ C-terminal domain-containing protein [Ktedonobacteraceae bacterium]
MQVGEITTWERTFTADDVRLFAQVSGDEGIHHMQPDEQGRLMVHGLLTATIPTKLGGDINYIAREMRFEFIRPVFVGDTIHCELVVTDMEVLPGRVKLASDFVSRNQYGKEVLKGSFQGVIRTPEL